jgi:septal ring factor EnvC (AmiA/AmiB activator)
MFILNAIGSFLLDHWIITLCSIAAIGVVIRIAYYASNPLAILTDTVEYVRLHWRTILAVILIAIPVFYVWKLNHTIAVQQATIAEQQVTITKQKATIAQDLIDINTLKQNAATLESAIKDANAMIAKFDKFTSDTKATFTKINQNVATQQSKLAQQIQDILHEKPPMTCEESIQYLITAVKGYAK